MSAWCTPSGSVISSCSTTPCTALASASTLCTCKGVARTTPWLKWPRRRHAWHRCPRGADHPGARTQCPHPAPSRTSAVRCHRVAALRKTPPRCLRQIRPVLLLWGVRGSWDGENVAELVLCSALSSAGAGTSLGPNLPCGKIQRYLATSGIPHFIFPYTGPPT